MKIGSKVRRVARDLHGQVTGRGAMIGTVVNLYGIGGVTVKWESGSVMRYKGYHLEEVSDAELHDQSADAGQRVLDL